MTIIETIVTVVTVLVIVGIVAYIIYTPYWVIARLIDKASQATHTKKSKRYSNNDIPGVKQEYHSNTNLYEILGCRSTDDNATIKKRYRELVKRYHPDFMQSKNTDESSKEFAKQKLQEINQAYEKIKQQRGI